MAIFDVRTAAEEEINQLRIADRSVGAYIVELISKTSYGVEMYDSADLNRALVIEDKEQAKNLIKGIQKAIDLGWLD